MSDRLTIAEGEFGQVTCDAGYLVVCAQARFEKELMAQFRGAWVAGDGIGWIRR
jgi:hypothetical protein